MVLGAELPLLPDRVLGVAEVGEGGAFCPGGGGVVLVSDAELRS